MQVYKIYLYLLLKTNPPLSDKQVASEAPGNERAGLQHAGGAL